MPFTRWFRRRSPGSGGGPVESGPSAEAVLVVAQEALRWLSPDRFGHGAYYVRVYRPASADLPVMIIADTGNDPAASSTNRFGEIAVLATAVMLGRPQARPDDLGRVATWINCRPAHGPFGETYYEMTFGAPGRGGHSPTGRYLRHAEVEELAGGPVEPLTFDDCAPARLRDRGVRVWSIG